MQPFNSSAEGEKMPFHPVADLFPLMTADEFEVLCLDIASNGLREEIWTHAGQIIDGRNRYNACREVKKTPRYREWDGIGSLVAFVVSLNLARRHLNESQRAMVAAKLANMQRGDNQHSGSDEDTQICGTISQTQAAELLNVSSRLVSSAKKVAEQGVPQLLAEVEHGVYTVSEAARIADLPKRRQKVIIQKGRKAARRILNRITERAVLQSARGKAVCVFCGPGIEDTQENFLGALQLMETRFPKRARYLADVKEEIAQEELSDDTRENYEKIFRAVDDGFAEVNDCRRVTGLDSSTFDVLMATMLDYGMIDFFTQGGKTDHARGARKKLIRIVDRTMGPKDLVYEIDADEPAEEYYER